MSESVVTVRDDVEETWREDVRRELTMFSICVVAFVIFAVMVIAGVIWL